MVRESLRLPWLPAYAILKFQSAFTRRVSQRFYFPVVEESTPVKNRLVDLLREQALGDQLPDLLGRRQIRSMFVLAEGFLGRAGGDQCLARFVVDDLGVDMFAGKINAETRTFRSARDFAPNPVVDPPANSFSIDRSHDY